MKLQSKRIIALALSLIMLFSMLPAEAAWDPWGFFPFFSPWFDPISGAKMEEAKTVSTSDDGTLIMYIGEKSYWTGTLDDGSNNSDATVATAAKSGDNQLLIEANDSKDGFTTLSLTGNSFCSIRVIKPSIELTKNAITVDPSDEYYILRARSSFRDQDGDGKLTWSSSDPSVVSVDDDGKLTFAALADNQESASAMITCEMQYTLHDINGNPVSPAESVSATCNVTVRRSLKKILLDATELEMYTDDEPMTVNITGCNPSYFYKDATIADMIAYSSKPGVLTVSKNGSRLTLTPVGKGTAKVVVSYDNVESYVIVKVLEEGLEISPVEIELPAGSTSTVVADVHPARKANLVSVVSSDPDVASVEWNVSDAQAVIRALKKGTTVLTFTLGSLTRTATVTVTDPVDDEDLYTVTFVDYDGNVLCTKEAPKSIAGSPSYVTIPTVNTVRDGFTFDHFERGNAPGKKYNPGDSLEVTGNMSLTAVYVPSTCKITYADTPESAAFGVELPASEDVPYGDQAEKPKYGINSDSTPVEIEVPLANGESRYYRFKNWETEDHKVYDFTDPVTKSLTLYPVWKEVECIVTVRTFKGEYPVTLSTSDGVFPGGKAGVYTLPKGTKNVKLDGLTMFTSSDGDYYTYSYTNANGVGKIVFFQFWQYGSERITTGSYTIDTLMDDATFTAVYEPGDPRSVGGPAVNDSTNSYYHSTNVYVPVNWKREDDQSVIHNEMVLTTVYPQYKLDKSNVFGIQYQYYTDEKWRELDKWDQLDGPFTAIDGKTYNASGNDTAKFGLVNLSDMVGTEITGDDNNNYLVVGIDQSKVEAEWLCSCDGHTFNGYCLGGTWNAFGQVTLYVREKPREAPKIKVNYLLLPDAQNDAEREAYRRGEVTEEQKEHAKLQSTDASELPVDEVLTYKDYVDNIGSYYPAVQHDWISGKEGDLTTKNGNYVLNLYYATIDYGVTVTYHYVDTLANVGNPAAPTVPPDDLGKDEVNPWTHDDDRFNPYDKFQKNTPYIEGYEADRASVSGTFTDHDIVEHVYYEPVVTLYYKALIGGKVTTAEEKVRKFDGNAVGSTAAADTVNGYVVKGWYAEESCSSQLLDAQEQTSKKFVPERPEDGWTDGTTFWAKFVKKIVITSADKTWTYDGKTHTEPVYTVIYGTETLTPDAGTDGLIFTLPDTGDKLTVSPTAAGVVYTYDWETGDKPNNTFSYSLDNSGNYSVETVFGVLDIVPATISVTSASRTWTYDGETHTEPKYTVKLGNETEASDTTVTEITLSTGDVLKITPTATGVTHVADSDDPSEKANNTFTCAFLQHADQYTDIEKVFGDLVITPRELTLVSGDGTKTWDGQPLTNDGIPADQRRSHDLKTETGWVKNDGATYDFTGSQTVVGSSENTFSYTFKDGTDSKDYTVIPVFGTLKVTPAALTITSPDGSWTYDGQPHQTDTITVTYGGDSVIMTWDSTGKIFTGTLANGDILTVRPDDTAVVTHVDETGTENNTFTWSVSDAAGTTDKTDLYKDSTTVGYGDLEITPKALSLISGDATKTWDGNPLTNSDVAGKNKNGLTTEDGWVPGDGATYTYTGSQTVVGSSENTFIFTFNTDTHPTDYTVTPVFGTLKVTPAALTITSPDASWTYDGETHHTETMTVTYGSDSVTMTWDSTNKVFTGTLANGDILTVRPDDSADVTHVEDTEGKTENNTFTWSVSDAAETTDKTGLYKDSTTVGYGDLEIIPKAVTLISGDATKTWDGNPLTNSDVTDKNANGLTTEEGWVPGEGAAYTYTGTQTEVGSNGNLFEYAFQSNTKSKDYTVTQTFGTLKVTPAALTIISPDGFWTYDGQPHQTDTITVTYGSETIPMTRNNDGTFTGTLTNGDTLTVTPKPGTVVTHVAETDGKTENNLFDWTVSGKTGNDKTDLYRDQTTAVYGDLAVNPAPVTLVSGNAEKIYDSKALTNTDVPADQKNANGLVTETGWAKGEGAAYTYTGTQTEIGKSSNAFSYKLNDNTDPRDYTVTKTEGTLKVTPSRIVIKTPDEEWTYDGEPHHTDTITVIVDGEEIPMTRDPSTGDFTGELPSGDTLIVTPTPGSTVTDVTDTKGKTENNTYTWTMEDPDHNSQYDVTPEYGDLKINPAPLKIVTPSDEKYFDGTPLTKEGTLTGLQKGDTVTFTTTGSQTEVGESTNTYSLVFDGTAKEDNYYIDGTDLGTLTVKPYTVEIKTPDDEWTYDGEPHHTDTITVIVNGEEIPMTRDPSTSDFTGELPSGDTLIVTPTPGSTVTDVTDTKGKTDNNTYTWTMEDPDHNDQYNVIPEYGDLKVNPAPLKIVTPSDQKPYDGTPLTKEGTLTGLQKGDTVTFTTTGSQTEVGESTNTYSLVFDGTAKEENYYIDNVDLGTLTVVPQEIVITTPDGKWVYDGDPHQTETVTVTYGGEEVPMTRNDDGTFTGTLPTGDRITVTPDPDATVTHVGDTKGEKENNTYTWTVEHPENYPEVVTNYGDLLITPAPLTVTTNSAEKVYDGTPLTAGGHVDGFADGETYTFFPTGSQTETGQSQNGYSLVFDGTADPEDYYIVEEHLGILKVTPEHKVVVHYWEEEVGGDPFLPDGIACYDEGEDYHIPSPVVPGYTVDIEIVEGTMGDSDVEVNVIYTPEEEKLTVRYVDEDGNPIHDPVSETHLTGDPYRVESPEIDGYITLTSVVEGRMPGHDTVITVVYFRTDTSRNLVSLNDYDTPLGLGGLSGNIGDCFE